MKTYHPLDPATDEDELHKLCPDWCEHLKRGLVCRCRVFDVKLERHREGFMYRADACLDCDLLD